MGGGSRRRWIAGMVAVAGLGLALAYNHNGVAPAWLSPIAHRPVTAAESKVLARAEQLLVQACMRRAGFRYWVLESPDPGPTPRGGPYVIGDLSWARTQGNGTDLATHQARQARKDPNSRYFASLTRPRQRDRPDGQAQAGRRHLPGRGPAERRSSSPLVLVSQSWPSTRCW